MTRTFAKRRFGLVMLVLIMATAVAASGAVYRSPYAPVIVGGLLAAVAGLVVSLRRPTWALYAALFVVLLPNGLLPAAVQSNLNRGLTVVAFAVWLISVFTQRRPIVWTVVASGMSVFVVWGLLTLAWTRNPNESFSEIQVYTLRLVLYLILVVNLICTEADLDGLMRVLALSGCVLIIAGLSTLLSEGYVPGSRLQILEMNENQTGMLALVTLVGVLWQVIRSSGTRRVVGMLLSFAFLAVSLALVAMSGSRGSAIAFAITLAAFWIWRSTRPWGKAAAALLVLALVAMPMLFSTLGARFALEEGDTALGGREAIWRAALELIRDNPVGGVGIGGVGSALMPYLTAVKSVAQHESISVHNPVLAIWAGTGAVGLLLYLFVPVTAVWLFASRFRTFWRGEGTFLGPYFALVSAVFVGYMAAWIKGGGMESDPTFSCCWRFLCFLRSSSAGNLFRFTTAAVQGRFCEASVRDR